MNREEYDKNLDSIYHCCKYCHHFSEGMCYKMRVYKEETFLEDDLLSERIGEALKDNNHFDSIVWTLREYGLSEEQVNTLKNHFDGLLERYKSEATERLMPILQGLGGYGAELDGVEIVNAEEHCCDEYE